MLPRASIIPNFLRMLVRALPIIAEETFKMSATSFTEKGIIESISIASDGLEPELIEETERILTGASIKKAPDCHGNEVAKDIISLIY